MSAERVREVQYTSEWTDAPTNTVPDWTNAKIVAMGPGTSDVSIAALGGTDYAVRTRVSDVYGQTSGWSTHRKHATLAGPDGVKTINLQNVPATVIVDDDGLTVEDGAITIKDAYGSVVLTSQGFGASWLDYITIGLPNYSFGAGVVGAITVPTAPPADLTSLPYWAFIAVTGDPLLERRADSLSPSGYALRFKFSAEDDEIYLGTNPSGGVGYGTNGVPVTPLSWYNAEVLMSLHQEAVGGGKPRIEVVLSLWDGEGEFSRSESVASYVEAFAGAADVANYLLVAESPIQTYNNEHYAAVDIFVDEVDGHNAANYIDIHSVALRDGVSETQLQQDLSLNSLHLRGDGAGNALHVQGPAYIADTLTADSDIEAYGAISSLTGNVGVGGGYVTIEGSGTDEGGELILNGGSSYSGRDWHIDSYADDLRIFEGSDVKMTFLGTTPVISCACRMRSSGEAWIAPTLTNSWVNYSTSHPSASYRIDSQGYVHLQGLLKDGTLDDTGNYPAFTLPAGYRPAKTLHFASLAYSALGQVRVINDGKVLLKAASNAWFAIDGITWLAEA